MSKFDNVKIGDKLWDILLQEWGTVENVSSGGLNVKYILDNNEYTMFYNLDGTCGNTKTPVLYYREKFIDTSDEIPFNLVEFLRDNLEPREFVCGDYNYYYFFWAKCEEWSICYDAINQDIKVYFEDRNDYFIDMLNKNKITPQQLRNAYRELGWL